jgi:hypothetical protein
MSISRLQERKHPLFVYIGHESYNLEFPCTNTLVVEWAKAEGQKCHAKTMEGMMILSQQNKKRREPGKKKCHARNYDAQ